MTQPEGQAKKQKSPVLTIALSAVMAALVAAATYLIQIPIPQTGGYLNVGDAMIFTAALIFGPVVGGFAGGVGSAISDLVLGFAGFAPITLVVKGVEGVLAGIISNGKSSPRDILGAVVGGAEMVLGYFLAEFFLLGAGYAALVEVPGNIFQVVFGGLIGLILSDIVRKHLPAISQMREASSPL